MAEDAMGFLSKDISSIGERRAADFYSMLPKRDKVLIELQGGKINNFLPTLVYRKLSFYLFASSSFKIIDLLHK